TARCGPAVGGAGPPRDVAVAPITRVPPSARLLMQPVRRMVIGRARLVLEQPVSTSAHRKVCRGCDNDYLLLSSLSHPLQTAVAVWLARAVIASLARVA